VTKLKMTKLALLGATAFLGAASAHAQVADTWAINGDVQVTSTNQAETTTLDPIAASTTGVDGATITAGFKNSVSGAAVGSSASSSFTSVNNSGVGGAAGLVIDGTVTVAAGNVAAVLNNNDIATGATISGGSANSISLAAVGSSASVSGSTTITDVGTSAATPIEGDETFAYTSGALTVSSGNADGVDTEAGSTVGGNAGTVTVTLASGVNVPLIEGGFGNSISVAGVGSSSSASFSATAGGEGVVLDSSTVTLTDGATINAANSDDGIVQVNLTEAGLVTPAIGGGNANSVSAAAVGSSASFSLASSTFGGGVITAFGAEVGELNVSSTNGENTVSLAAADGDGATAINGATIAGLASNGNSISASAVGSSGSVSFSNTVNSVSGGAAGGDVTFAAINVNSTNAGAITNNTSVTELATIEGGSRNSISVAGVGSSASQSLSTTDYSGAGLTQVNAATGAITLAALNTGAVSVSGGLANAAITDGFSNSVSAAAVGASASQSVSRTVVGVVQ
jgi:hypothetical protein